ncbi:hypothetical protein V2J09_016799 [Rumex salicifolius]
MYSRVRGSSPLGNRRASSSYLSSSSTSSILNASGRSAPRSSASSAIRSPAPRRIQGGSMYGRARSYGAPPRSSPVGFPSDDLLLGDSAEMPRPPGDSISVTVRFRPMNEREYNRGDENAWYPDSEKIVRSEYNYSTAYAYDKVFGPNATTEEVYEVAARPVIKSAMEGVNGTVFAYGVTSSGKTHTMHGDQCFPGIIPLAIKDVFSMIQDTPGREFLLRVSYLEIYNEVINDLLNPTGQNLRVREDTQGTYVEGIKEEVVLSPGHTLSFIAAGEEHRHVGSNNYNLLSSRSHTIFTLMIESSAHADEYDGVIFSQLNLIDLAGSESAKTETTGLRRKEGSYINKSLLTLGTVIGKLSEGKSYHVPYRDSKLTRLLQSSLSGHGHVSLICTVTPASSSMEETHNTLKFASRAKRVEIYASRNKIIDEKSLIKKYQREISTLKQELYQLKRGMLVGVSHEEITSLRQKLEEGQVKMQSRLEEEEDAKVALMSRIQRLTKLILVSTKNTIPEMLGDVPSHQRSHSAGDDDKLDVFKEVSLLLDTEVIKDSPFSGVADFCGAFKHKTSSSKCNDYILSRSSIVTESHQGVELISGSKLPVGDAVSDEMDLLVEQVKMLTGDIAFSKSTLKRMVEQSVYNPEASKTQIHNLELEIQEKKKQLRVLEQRIAQSDEASVANTSLLDVQQTVMRLTTQCNEKGFELELKAADNRILQEQLQDKCAENEALQERIQALEQQICLLTGDISLSSLNCHVPDGYVNELKNKVKLQETENENIKLQNVQILEDNSGLRVQNQKLSEEASLAKELASSAAVELKNLAGEAIHVRNASIQGGNRRHKDVVKQGRRGLFSARTNDMSSNTYADFDWDGHKMELQARKQYEAILEAALAEKEIVEEEYRKKAEEAKRRETALENDLANMWAVVAKLKKEGTTILETKTDERQNSGEILRQYRINDVHEKDTLKETQALQGTESVQDTPKEEPLVARLKARVQEMKEQELKNVVNGDTNSHVCKVCFESATAAILLPCRHFSLCKPCSLACSECPICRAALDLGIEGLFCDFQVVV